MSDRIEQTTAAPGEVRNVEVPDNLRCWRLTGVGSERCHLHYGHIGDCDSLVAVVSDDSANAEDRRGEA